MGRPLKIAKAQAVIILTATNATTDAVTSSSNLNLQGIIAGMPFIPAANIGGLVAGTTYWILKILSDTTFTVSATPLNANPNSTPVDLSATTGQSVLATIAPVDFGFNNPAGSANTYSVVGGNTRIYGNQVLANVCIGQEGVGVISASDDSPNISGVGTAFDELNDGTILYTLDGEILGTIDDVANATANAATFAANATANVSNVAFVFGLPEDGYIVRQKGKQKYLVKGLSTGLTGACFTANVANTALLPNTMTITATYANSSTQLIQSLSDHNAELFTANSGPVATGNIVLEDADPAFVTFNSAEAANVDAGIPYPIVTIDKA